MKLVELLILAVACLILSQAASASTIGAPAGLTEGAAAIRAGDYRRGVELTLQGLAEVPATRDRAAGLSNLCAGLVGLGDYAEALRRCNESLAINDGNWRTWANRAAALLGLGLVSRAISDVERGLLLSPESETLSLILEIARSRLEDRQRQRQRLTPPSDRVA